MLTAASAPPTPQQPMPTGEDAARWRHSALRRRMLDGRWERDLQTRVQEHVGSVRADAWGTIDCSANPFRVICRELSTLYLDAPHIRHDQDGADEISKAMSEAGLWAMMPRHQSRVIGCREYLLRVHATKQGQLRYRPVPPDLVIADADAELPDWPVRICELRERLIGGDYRWAWDVLDVSDPKQPVYQVRLSDSAGKPLGEDLSERFLGGNRSGSHYPYRRADGTPVLPYVLHHAERRGDQLWDAFEGIELVGGALTLGVLYTFWLHLVQDASWPQRYALNARPAGLETRDQHGNVTRLEIVTDPATLLILEKMLEDPAAQAIIGQFQAGGNPKELLEAIDSYAARLAQDAGVSGTDLLRTSGDPRSGYALSLSNEGKRAAQRRFTPQFRESDRWMVALSAILLNRASGSSLPEDGYSVLYQQIPLSPDELAARRDHVLALVDAGLLSKVDGYMELNPGLTRKQAEKELERIEAENKRFEPAKPQPPAAPPPSDPNNPPPADDEQRQAA